jgi:dTDP-glucose 4,6-dehydratase
VTDLIDGIVRLARSDEQGPVNIGNPVEWTVAECAREVLAVTGSQSKLQTLPLPVDDPARRRPDITRARTVLGWEPKVQLREGLNLCIPYFTHAVEESAKARPSVG